MVSLFLMGEKGLAVLKSIVDCHFVSYIDNVITSKDPNVIEDFHNDIVSLCKDVGIAVFDRGNMPSITASYLIAVSWRWIIDVESAKLIVLHDSLLPKYRGFAPLVNMLINKEPEIGVTAILGENDYDTGDIILQKKVAVGYPIKIIDAIKLITPLYNQIVIEIIQHIVDGEELGLCPQLEEQATYSLWRDKKDYLINWTKSADEIQQFVYSVGYPYLGACSIMNGQQVRIWDCEVVPDKIIENRDCGKTIFMQKGMPIVVCGQGLLKLTEITNESGISLLPLSSFRNRFE